jgi:hypothetical protein
MNTSEIRSFLGLAGYYHRFIKDFSKIAKPMTRLLEKNKDFDWTEECQVSFEELKKRLTLAPVLILPYISKKFDIYCDCHSPFRDSGNEASIRVPRMFHSHI